jgi:hypothetical protein
MSDRKMGKWDREGTLLKDWRVGSWLGADDLLPSYLSSTLVN